MLKICAYIIVVLVATIINVNSLNILVLEATPSPSHHIWIKSLTIELASKGYNITSLSSDVDSTKTENLHYLYMNGVYDEIYNSSAEESDLLAMGSNGRYQMISLVNDFFYLGCKGAIKSRGYHQLLQYPDNFKFDLILHDIMGHPCLLPFIHKFNNPPVISMTAFNSLALTSAIVGSTISPSVPYFFDNYAKEDTFLWRVNNYLLYIADYYVTRYNEGMYQNILNEYFKGLPKLSELKKRTNLVFLNYNPMFELSEPILPNVILCGGMQVTKPKPLPATFLEGLVSKNNLVYFSMGTNLRSDSLGDERLTHILEAFRSLPEYTFLWKFESDTLPVDVPKNVHIKAWMPQNDIFAELDVKLFITHSGLLSTLEALWYGVPMLGVPIFADQFMNIQKCIDLGIGQKYILRDLNSKTFAASIKQAMENKELSINSKAFSKTIRDQPETSLERAVWWTEWLIRNPESSKYLSSPSVDLWFLQRESIDIIAFLTVIVIMLVCIIFKFFKFLLSLRSRKSKVKIN